MVHFQCSEFRRQKLVQLQWFVRIFMFLPFLQFFLFFRRKFRLIGQLFSASVSLNTCTFGKLRRFLSRQERLVKEEFVYNLVKRATNFYFTALKLFKKNCLLLADAFSLRQTMVLTSSEAVYRI